jgi:hypothetical protein
MEHDPELRPFIRNWTPPPAPDLDARMLSRYAARRPSLWRRRLELRLSIPVPLLAALVVLAAGGALWLDQRARAAATLRERLGGFDPVASPTLVVTRAEVKP